MNNKKEFVLSNNVNLVISSQLQQCDFHIESTRITVLGRPILPGKTEKEIAALFAYNKRSESVAKGLNGSFIIVVKRKNCVEIINDRFASIPIFYIHSNGKLIVSTDYLDLVRRISRLQTDQLCLQSIVEFVYFQRIHGTETFHTAIKFLNAASVLRRENVDGHIKLNKYWTPDFSKSNSSENDLSVELAEALRKSVSRRIEEDEYPGLLLSGGLDSRAVLAAFPDDVKPYCYTIGDFKNNEVTVAEQVANAAGCEWQFLERDFQHYSNVLDDAVLKGSGMYVFDHGHFFNFDWGNSSRMFHGHGLDYFFQGMYLPYKNLKIMGGDTFYKNLRKLDLNGLTSTYMNSAKFRLKSEGLEGLIRPEVRNLFLEDIKSKLSGIVNTIASNVVEIYDIWDYLYLHNPSRHYTYLNVISMNNGSSTQLTAAFDNDVYDQYLKMPADMRMKGNAYIKSITHMNPSLMNIRNANTNMVMQPSPIKMTVKAVKRKVLRKAGLKDDLQYPSKGEGSWPVRDKVVNQNKLLRHKMMNLVDSPALESLGIFDNSSIKEVVAGQLDGTRSNGPLILTLLTVQEFFERVNLGVDFE